MYTHLDNFMSRLNVIPYHALTFFVSKLDNAVAQTAAGTGGYHLYDDKVLITFNYKEGTETVAFGEAVKAEKSSDMSARGAPIKER